MDFVSYSELKSYSDEQLAQLSQQGNADAENELVVRSLPTVKYLVSKFSSFDNSVGEDDFVQEALIGVLSAIQSFDKNRGASFITFASRCAENRLVSFYKKTSSRQKPTVELDELNQTDYTSEPETFFVAQESFEKFLLSVRRALTSNELAVLNCYLKGMSYEQIASTLSLSVKAVDNALFRARKKIKAMK